MAGVSDYPTILIFHGNREFQNALTRNLQQRSYLILEAQDAVEALEIAIRHSRRIHLLLADDRDDGRIMAARLKPYRPQTNVIYISADLDCSLILAEVSKVLEPPRLVSKG